MPSPRRAFMNNTAVFVTTRIEEGLPLVPTGFMNMIIWSVLAKAQALYPDVAVCAFIFLLNHFHMLLAVEDPEQVSKFTGYVKQEIAHAVNRLLNRRQKTIWKAEYDAPTVLDFEKLLAVLAYIYLNPVEAGLECTVGDYPGVSSWGMMKTDNPSRWCETISRDSVRRHQTPKSPHLQDKSICNHFKEVSKLSLRFDLKAFAWKKCFSETLGKSDTELKGLLLERITKRECELAEERKKRGITVLGKSALVCSSMLKEYTPKKHGKRMLCLASCKELRVEYITFYKNLCARAKAVYEKWKAFDYSEAYPEGLFPPSLTRRTNIFKWGIGGDLGPGHSLYSIA